MFSGLVKNGNVYYFRLRIPADVRRYFRRSEVKKSLRVSRFREAKSLVRRYAAEAEKVFTMLRSNVLTMPDAYKLAESYLENLLNDAQAFPFDLSDDQMYEAAKDWTDTYVASQIRENRQTLARTPLAEYPVYKAKKLLSGAGYGDVDDKTAEFRVLCEEILKAQITFWEISTCRLNGEGHPYEEVLKNKRRSGTLAEAMQGYINRKQKTVGARSLKKYREKMVKVIECLEYETKNRDIRLSDITYQLTVKIAERLKEYPQRRESKYKNKSLDEIYTHHPEFERPSPSTVKEELHILSTFCDEALKNHHGLERNFAQNLAHDLIGEDSRKESECRDPFAQEDIAEIIRELARRKGKGEFKKNPHLLFIPLIALLQGARANEICQLYVDDIMQLGGVWCISHNVDKSGKSLKNKNSKRINPIHPVLLDLGLIKFWESQKAKGMSRLWEGEKNHSCGYYPVQDNHAHYFCKWFNGTFKKQLTLTNPKLQTFHSARHAFIDWYYQHTNVFETGQNLQALVGHLDEDDKLIIIRQGYDPNSITFRTYTDGVGLYAARQHETLKLLDYGVDLSGLRWDS